MTLEYITEKNAPTDAEIMQYMKLPLILFKEENFKETLSLSAKVLYCFLLDRSNLSLKNADSFTDKEGRAFIFFSWEEAMDTLQCARQKVNKTFKELVHSGLIEKVSRGLGKSPKIYVMRFYNEQTKETVPVETSQSMTKFVECENHTTGYENHTRYIESDLPKTDLPCYSDLSATKSENKKRQMDAISYEEKLEQAQAQITSEKTKRFGSKAIAEIAAILAWVAKTAKKTLKVGGIDVRTETIREKLQNLTVEQTAEVMSNTMNRKIKNRRSYLLTCLYHAADSMTASAIPRSENADAYESFIFNLC